MQTNTTTKRSRKARAESYFQGVTDAARACESIRRGGSVGYGCIRFEGFGANCADKDYRSGFAQGWRVNGGDRLTAAAGQLAGQAAYIPAAGMNNLVAA